MNAFAYLDILEHIASNLLMFAQVHHAKTVAHAQLMDQVI
jgi:hypothetical protein